MSALEGVQVGDVIWISKNYDFNKTRWVAAPVTKVLKLYLEAGGEKWNIANGRLRGADAWSSRYAYKIEPPQMEQANLAYDEWNTKMQLRAIDWNGLTHGQAVEMLYRYKKMMGE